MAGVAERALPADVAERAATVLRALAEPVRLRIVSAVAASPTGRLAAGEVVAVTDLAGPTVSHHLRSLREAGVLLSERRGTWVHYRLAPGMDRVAGSVLDSLAAAAALAGQGSAGTGAEPAEDDDAYALLQADARLERVADRLAARFPDLEPGLVLRVVRESYAALGSSARVTRHLPVLAERFARQRLEDVVRVLGEGAERGVAARRPQVLFVCVANAGRSQLAAALLRKHARDAVVVRSAGSMPAPEVHAAVVPYLVELVDPADPDGEPFPKPLTDDAVRAADVVVTMGCGDSCPVLPGKRYEDWPVGDPALASPDGVRAIRDEIQERVLALAAELTAPTGVARPEENP